MTAATTTTTPGTGVPFPRTGTALAVTGAVVAAAALATVLAAAPDGLRASADPGAPTVPYLVVLGPTVLALALTWTLPRRAPVLAPRVADRRRVLLAVMLLLACAAAFPLVVAATGVAASADYHLVKIVLLVAVPGGVVLATRGLRTGWPRAAWRWWAPLVVVGVWTAVARAAPWVQEPDYGEVPVDLLVTAAVATAVTAGVGEELFFRVWLQTRLEALLGRWGGITVATLAFALMHVGSRQHGGALVEVSGAIVVQGLGFGLVAACLWSRYRNAWLVVLLHVLANGFGIAVLLLG
ncbi:CPBP family intramembrane glutamic endopeptidase [Cellulomonas wangsupingiae]|uniref:CPBP family intramembrane glutamic endopeptidase n=1 Tax=Cellulomonas wangsupingiae TaxID=2968085 RepID=UPI001D0EC3AE|nr:CPBP family intramembrane glutamic endopeptidase [Cellulomonas wangsupingiae]MCM0639563.1 CPBP family intramembrane metalloprotease [Cellulomonas wangsupingiae]